MLLPASLSERLRATFARGRSSSSSGDYRRGDGRVALLFLLPDFVGFFVFTLLGVVATLAISFTHWDLVGSPSWAGFGNYRELVDDPLFWKVLRNTAYYTLAVVPLSTVLGLLVAMGLNRGLPGTVFLRTAYFAPFITTLAAAALLWQWIFDPSRGLIDSFLYQIGVSNVPAWLNSSVWAMPALIVFGVWRQLGFSMVLFVAGLQNVPKPLIDAATVDGANAWQRFRHITLPMISPTTFFVVIISTIGSFQLFDQAFILTSGRFGPANATNTIVGYLYQKAFVDLNMGVASAVAWALFLIIFAVTIFQLVGQRRWVHYE
ncbi:MAG: sugar ABC transporter permease [Chloroflexota bacterium]